MCKIDEQGFYSVSKSVVRVGGSETQSASWSEQLHARVLYAIICVLLSVSVALKLQARCVSLNALLMQGGSLCTADGSQDVDAHTSHVFCRREAEFSRAADVADTEGRLTSPGCWGIPSLVFFSIIWESLL